MKRQAILIMVPVFVLAAWAQGPYDTGTYYQAADGKKGVELKTALFQIISPHEVQSYTPGVWDAINSYDIRPDGKIWDIYSEVSNFTPKDDQHQGEKIQDEGKAYNREHAMPKSWFNEGSNATDYPMYTDLHHLFPTDYIVNEMRSNYPYGEVDKSMKPTKQSEGGFSKFGICDPSIGYTVVNGKPRVFEPNDEYKGDLARVYFYMATCYEAYKTNAGKERSPLDWDKSDKTMLDGTIYPFFKEWAIKMLLRWAIEDPVSEKEINRNAAIFGRQKNRNPFVDYPGLEQYIWGSSTDVAFSYDNYIMPDMSGGNAQGDVNGDGKIDIADVVALSIAILTGSTDLKYDINNDEKVNSEDIIALVNIIVG
jgi:endonuclease I